MIGKLKICMLGASAVGKTSLVGRFLSNSFHERYATTIGVKIQSRQIPRGEHTLQLVLWDLSGDDEFQSVQPSYLLGAAGYLLVIDGTRRKTIDTALDLRERTRRTIGDVPFRVLLNKADLHSRWDIDAPTLQELEERRWSLSRTSARTGEGVEASFLALADAILHERKDQSWK